MRTPYQTEAEATLAKALLEIGGECIGETSPAEYARMTLDDVYPGRAEGSTAPPLRGRMASLVDVGDVPLRRHGEEGVYEC